MTRFDYGHIRRDVGDGLPQRFSLFGRRLIAARQYDKPGSTETPSRLAEETARQQITVPPRRGRID